MAKTVFQEMVQLRKCLLCKHKNPSAAPQHSRKSEVGWCFFNFHAQGQMQTGGMPGACCPARLAESVSKRVGVGKNRGRHLWPPQACTNMQIKMATSEWLRQLWCHPYHRIMTAMKRKELYLYLYISLYLYLLYKHINSYCLI